jgi:hypothetical protein
MKASTQHMTIAKPMFRHMPAPAHIAHIFFATTKTQTSCAAQAIAERTIDVLAWALAATS